MPYLLSTLPMDRIVEGLKSLGTTLAVLAPIFRLFAVRWQGGVRELEDRHRRLKAFFDAGGADQHPILMESAFGAAIGHTKLDACEIPLILSQKKPTLFLSSYLKVRSYLEPNEDGSQFRLRSLAAKPLLRGLTVAVGAIIYAVFAFAAMWLLLYQAPQLALQQAWAQFAGHLALAILFGAVGAYCLVGASRLHWAAKLFSTQRLAGH